MSMRINEHINGDSSRHTVKHRGVGGRCTNKDPNESLLKTHASASHPSGILLALVPGVSGRLTQGRDD